MSLTNRLKEYIYTLLCNKQEVRSPRFPHIDRPLKVLVVYESDVLERNDRIKEIRQDLLRRQMDVTTCGYVEKKTIQTLILPQSRILGTADYNWYGKPKDATLNDLQAEHYDLLIDLTTKPLLPLRYLALYADADFKVGLHFEGARYDMMLALSAPTPEPGKEDEGIPVPMLYEQIMNYLTMIKSND